MKSGNLNFLEPSGPLQACNGTALPYIYITRLASNEIFSPSNKIHREAGRAKDLSASRCNNAQEVGHPSLTSAAEKCCKFMVYKVK
jgi:hypothetical protein